MECIQLSFFNYPTCEQSGVLARELERLIPAVVFLKTCQRCELYISKQGLDVSHISLIEKYLGDHSDKVSVEYNNRKISNHLFNVVSGLASQVIGETEIQGQIKAAYLVSIDKNKIDSTLHRLFQKALFIGKKVRFETRLSDGGFSYAGAAFRVIKDRFGDYSNLKVAIFGAGAIAQEFSLIAKKNRLPISGVFVRDIEKAGSALVDLVECPISFIQEGLLSLNQFDVLVCATGATGFVVETNHVRHLDTLFCVDFSSSSNIHPSVEEVDGVTLVTLENLVQRIKSVSNNRALAISSATQIVSDEMTCFLEVESAKVSSLV